MLPQLRKLEERFPSELAVVGVHSGKFLAERMTPNIRQAVMRLAVGHPVVNDRYFRTWRAYGVNAWPTLVLLDPTGKFLDIHPGEITFEQLEPVVRQIVESFDARGKIDRRPLPMRLERSLEPSRPLSFPGKVISDGGSRLFMSDSRHHRVLVVEAQAGSTRGRVLSVIGSGQPGFNDGGYTDAAFDFPHGLALDGEFLYVADTENHAIRLVDLAREQVQTIAGTGSQARRLQSLGMGQAADLSSPWDVSIIRRQLYVAMAGTHQIWQMDIDSRNIRVFAGSGHEDIYDAPARQASLAQPSGLSADGDVLYFADSETSAIRRVGTEHDHRVETLVGTGLFDFGDNDGAGDEVRLQHPLGIRFHEGEVLVADTYNNKIKSVQPGTRRATTLFGDGTPGHVDGESAQFWEPSGLTVADSRLFVADTNNHSIRIVDLASGKTSTLELEGLTG